MVPHFPPLNCPRCGMVDRVQKVSALVAAGASTAVTTGYEPAGGDTSGAAGSEFGIVTTARVRQEGSQRTDLSKLLLPPTEPPLAGARSAGTDIAAGLSAFALCSLTSAGAAALASGKAGIGVYGVLLACAVDVGVVVLVLRTRRSDERLQAARQADHAQWETEMAKWEELYYCWRDDVVFFPGNLSATPASSMRTIL